MEKTYLIINPGSASRKCAFWRGSQEVARAHFEKENGGFVVTLAFDSQETKISITSDQFEGATKYFFDFLVSKKIINNSDEINAIGVRVVAPGDYFLSHRFIDDAYIEHLRDAVEQAPLHIGPALKEIESIKNIFPAAMIVGVSDSAYHSTMVRPARHYALPKNTSESLGIYRYGYHGISAESVVRQSGVLFGNIPSKMVICHLGSGSSITAVRDGKSVDTSMGFTPLEGMIMATRIGDIDAGALLYLQKKLDMTPDALNEHLNSKCGLLGVSDKSSDIRELIELEKNGNADAALALEIFVHRVKKYIGAYASLLNGIDALVFTGTIGERSFIMRERICSDMDFLGINIDKQKNNMTENRGGLINLDSSNVGVAIVMTDEMKEIAFETAKLV